MNYKDFGIELRNRFILMLMVIITLYGIVYLYKTFTGSW